MYLKNNHRARQPRQGGGRFSGWNRHHYGGLSDSDLPHQHRSLSPPSARELGFFCTPKKEGDIEDSYSIDSSTFSTQSEQPQKTPFEYVESEVFYNSIVVSLTNRNFLVLM